MSRFFCLYIPHFPAWAASRADPTLHDKPVFVYAGGRVLAASPEVRDAGVQIGWSLPRAQALLSDAIGVPHHAPTTARVWDEVLDALYELTPCIESIRPGLAVVDIQSSSTVVPLLRQWSAHGGVADDRTTAELAALTAQPGKLRSVRTGCNLAFLRHVPVTILHEVGVSNETTEKLGWFGWHTVGHLRFLTKRQLVSQFNEGELLFRYAQATDTRPVRTYIKPPSICSHYRFEEPVREPCEIDPVLDLLVERACEGLDGRLAHFVTVGIQTSSGWQRGRRLLKEATAVRPTIRTAADFELQSIGQSSTPITAMEITLGGLSRPQTVRGCLFAPARPPVETVIRAMEAHFPGLLRRIVITDPHAYLPEEGFTLEPITLPDAVKSTKVGLNRWRSAVRQ